MAAPAVRILMLDVQLAHDSAGGGQVGQNGLVGSPDALTSVLAGLLGQIAAVVYGDGDGDLGVLLADVEVIAPWPPAVWTQPEPLSSVTWSPRMTQPSLGR